MFNETILVGRLTAKPELRYTSSNIPYTRFCVAIDSGIENDGERVTDFINCIVWRKQAENMCTYLNKGSLILAKGSISNRAYTDAEGNRKYSTEVVAQTIKFLEKKSSNETEETTKDPNEDEFAQFGNDVVEIDDNFLD